MNDVKLLLTCLVATSALVSAGLWVKSARVMVLADDRTSGYGAVLGGDLIAEGENGERIDLHATLAAQSHWNRWAAYSAAVCAALQGLLTSFFPS